jgi:putative transposase
VAILGNDAKSSWTGSDGEEREGYVRQQLAEVVAKSETSISYSKQCKSLTALRAQDPAFLAINAQSAQVTLRRLERAFDNFFRRVREGSKRPGFQRFKSRDRWSGFGFKTHGDGFTLTPGKGWRHGKLRVSGVGEISVRDEARTPDRIVACDLMRKADGWFASIVLECQPHREPSEREVGLDWGIETLATLAYAPGECDNFENDRPLAAEQELLRTEQRALCKALRGKRSKRTAKLRWAMARRHRRVAKRPQGAQPPDHGAARARPQADRHRGTGRQEHDSHGSRYPPKRPA